MTTSLKTDAVVLRSFRYGEADRILHLQTREVGRISAIAKGARRTRSRLGGRLEPVSHTRVVLRVGRGEVATIVGADLVDGFDAIRTDTGRLAVAMIGVEAVIRLYPEPAPQPRVFDGLVRFLHLAATRSTPAPVGADVDPLALGFCLKLIALAGWAPRIDACASCGSQAPLVRYSPSTGGGLCASCDGGFVLGAATLAVVSRLLAEPLEAGVDAPAPALRQARRIVDETIAEHTGGRLRTINRVVM